MIRSGTVASSVKSAFRVPSTAASAISSEQGVGFAVDHAIALLDRGAADRLGEMALAGAGWAEKERVLALLDEARGREVEDERAVHLLVEVEIEILERAIGVAEARQLVPARQQPVFAPAELVGDERGHEIERGQPFGLGVAQAGFEDVGHAGEPEFAERTIDFDERHSEPPVF